MQEQYRVVTQEQLQNGYLVLDGQIVREKQFEIVRKNDDGTYVVINPEYAMKKKEIK